MTNIKANIENIRKAMEDIASKSARRPSELNLVAVSKTRSPEEINMAIGAGITDIGENKVQEILDKYDKIQPVRWHMIGHLQTNKVKYIIDKVALIHSVDSFRLAKEINKRAGQHGLVMDVLVQINVAEEESKFGIKPNETEMIIRNILENCPNICIKGLMTIVPFADDPEMVRKYFRRVSCLYEDFKLIDHERIDFQYLSMGMSNDYKVAIEEGANTVRIGTSIFGERKYKE